MPSSTHNVTRQDIIKDAYARFGVQNASNDENSDAVRKLNSIIKVIDKAGRWLWAISETEFPLTTVVGQRAYTTGVGASNIRDDILALETVQRKRGANNFEILRILDKPDSAKTFERERSGEPFSVYLQREPLAANQKLLIFPLPSSTFDVIYTYRRKLFDFVNPNDNPDFQPEWQIALELMLASQLIDSFGKSLQERQWINQQAQAALRQMLASNNERDSDDKRAQAEYF